MTLKQWVNLPKQDRFVEDGIGSTSELGNIQIEVEFGTEEPAVGKSRMVPVGNVQSYTAREKADNGNFELRDNSWVGKPLGQKNWMSMDDFQLPAAGGDQYKMEIERDGKVVSTGEPIQAWRRLYYQVVVMWPPAVPEPNRPRAAIKAVGLGTMEGTLLKSFIELKERGGRGGVPFSSGSYWPDVYHQTVRECGARPTFAPYLFTLAFVHALPKATETSYDFVVAIYPGATYLDLTFPNPVWYGLDDGDDFRSPNGSWVCSGSCKLVDGATDYAIPDDWVRLAPAPPALGPYGGFKGVRIYLTPEAQRGCAGKNVRLVMRLKHLDYFINGCAANGACILARMVNFADRADDGIRQTIIHELGHAIGMVPAGMPRQLDRPGTQYGNYTAERDQYGHAGSHCSTGLSSMGTTWVGAPGCVMFGASGGWTAEGRSAQAPASFCGTCTPLVIKLDLSSPGW